MVDRKSKQVILTSSRTRRGLFFYKPCVANQLLLLTSQWHVVLLVISAHNKLPSKAPQQSSYPCTRRRLYPASHTLRINCSCLLHHNGMWRGLLMLLVTSSLRKLASHTANCTLQLDQLKTNEQFSQWRPIPDTDRDSLSHNDAYFDSQNGCTGSHNSGAIPLRTASGTLEMSASTANKRTILGHSNLRFHKFLRAFFLCS